MLVSAIVAMDRQRAIGHANEIPWYLPADLAFFKRKTLDHCVIMGRNTWVSIGRPLPKRTNIVVTRDPYFVADSVVVVRSIESALEYAFDQGEQEAFIIGGGDIYRQTMPYWDQLYLTEVDTQVPEATVFFPELDPTEWEEVSREVRPADEKNEFACTFLMLRRVSGGRES
jgi:dihydrofolate reductase